MALTPMMQKWQSVKAAHPDCIVFFRLGDFYEMFFDDAKEASKALSITLTARDCGLPERAPMCGVPFHASSTYIKKLIEKGFRVAICEQLTAPQKGKNMVERDVVRIVTAGTYDDEAFLDETKNNYIAAVYTSGERASVAWCDITTGDFYAMNTKSADVENVVAMINPREIIDSNGHYGYAFGSASAYQSILRFFNITNIRVFDLENDDKVINSAGALLHYINMTQKRNLPNIEKISVVKSSEYMTIDKTAREHLEILHQFRNPAHKNGSLLWVLDATNTPMGARELSRQLVSPLQDIGAINARLDCVSTLVNDGQMLKQLRLALSNISDISRLMGRAANGSITPRDFWTLKNSLENVGVVRGVLENAGASFAVYRDAIKPLPELCDQIAKTIADNPPVKTDEGGFVRAGFNKTLDDYRGVGVHAREWLTRLENGARDVTGIRELKIAYNRIVGYYFEIPAKHAAKMSYDFQKKGSTAQTERYTNAELKNLEDKILNATESAVGLELKILADLRGAVVACMPQINENARTVGLVDMLASFAWVAAHNGYTRPSFNKSGKIELKNARHPVVEKLVGVANFIANDCAVQNSTMLITGPNMAGKSTYMRMVASVVIMAHVGSFVPADSADINLTDRVFTRIGASDSLQSGESTFMVEMNEVSNIVHNATRRSLVLLDEVGRGTGTSDGFALASAIITHITDKIGSNTMFATHFHELTNLSNPKIQNYKVLTEQIDNEIVFLHKVERGVEQNSFGIDVAKLSGLPNEIIEAARRLQK